ncbi:uncharacterized protein F5891DRAFT_1180362 [Suillus fuscotomentosus]|uniref:BTB domain-containing protein n=1 Tax=Suillus fuscotomentosus TaxID=1912939 RepID=A0AAD4EM95_9AGAM|nr:uncharacterized protein F5891DRAFT_1180362 [Suillus fuscotomentosus]KAG1908798.1 hypothetical protein F5891DRAFT_1180362 [Suillus fuscotomentosus]
MQVENALFKVHATQLSCSSIAFEEMFSVGSQFQPMEGLEGLSDDYPIVIPELSMNMFELFLSIAYSSWKPKGPTHDDVVNLLQFSNKFMSQKACDVAINHIQEHRFQHKPYELLALCLEFSIQKFFVPAFRCLIEFRIRDIPGPVRKRLGFEQLWWNSMACFLLDGRNPQDFHDAVERFQELGSEIGRVNPECWKTLLQTVKKGAAFHLAFDIIEETAQQLSAALITEPGSMLTRAELDTLGHQ